MKKTLILASALVFAISLASYADTDVKTKQITTQKAGNRIEMPNRPDFQRPPKGPDFKKRQAEFDKRLNLTDKQKTKAEEIRKQGFDKMKPIMEKTKEKSIELKKLRDANNENNKAQIEQLHKELQALKKEAHEIRQQNMKDFEAILTKKQKKELQTMKEEGRKKFEQERKKNYHGPINKLPRPPLQEEIK